MASGSGTQGRLSAQSSSQRLRDGYASISRGRPSDNGAAQQGRAASSGAALGLHASPDPHALESLDDLIRQEQQQRQQRSVTMPVSATADARDSALLSDEGFDAGDDLTSSTATIRPHDGSATPRQSRLSAVAGDSSFSHSSKPRDESRWNGWHLWRMESYTRRVTEQQQANDDARRAQRWQWPLQYIQDIRERFARGSRSLRTASANGHDEHEQDDEDAMAGRTDARAEDESGIPKMPLLRMLLLTIVIAGVQIAWCLEFGYGTPFLLSIGLSKSATSLVWLAAPVSGLVVQPLIGVLSDISTSSCRRRQYILGSTLIVVLCAIVLAFSTAFATMLTDILHAGLADWDPIRLQIRDDMNRLLAVVAFIFLDLSINGVQAASRALILDVTPSQLHSQVNAWAARMQHAGSIFGYAAGWYDLSSASWLGWIGGGQFRKYSLVSLFFIAVCSITTCLAIQEGGQGDYEAVSSRTESNGESGAATAAITRTSAANDRENQVTFSEKASEAVSHIWQSIRRLPRAVRRICLVQLFAHMGWFPFLVYATQWIIETRHKDDPANERQGSTGANDQDTEIGSFALLMFALVSLAAGIVLPLLTLSHRPERSIRLEGSEHERARLNGQAGKRTILGRSTWRLSLRTIWTLSLVLYGAIATVGTFFVKDVHDAIVLVALVGIPWAVTVWVPYALVMESVREAEDGNSPFEFEADWFAPERVRNRRSASSHGRQGSDLGSRARARAQRALQDCGPLVTRSGINGEQPRMPGSILARGGEIVGGTAGDGRVTSSVSSPAGRATFGEGVTGEPARFGRHPYDTAEAADEDSVGGTVLGIHNMSVVIPQLLTAVFAAAILRSQPTTLLIGTLQTSVATYMPSYAEPAAGSGGVGVVWIIRLGGVASFIAAALTRLVPLTRTERMVLSSLKGKPIPSNNGSTSNTISAPRFDDEASDGEEEGDGEDGVDAVIRS